MKKTVIYIAGCLILMPAVIGALSGVVLIMLLAVLYGAAVFFSPSFSPVARRFWREWHRINFQLTNMISK